MQPGNRRSRLSNFWNNGRPVSLITDADSSHVTALQKKYHSIELWSNIVYRGWDSSYFSDTPYMNFLYGKDCMYLVEKSLKFCRENTVQVSRPYSFLTFPKKMPLLTVPLFNLLFDVLSVQNLPLKCGMRLLISFVFRD